MKTNHAPVGKDGLRKPKESWIILSIRAIVVCGIMFNALGGTVFGQSPSVPPCTRIWANHEDSTLLRVAPHKVSFGLGPCSEACELSQADALEFLKQHPSIRELETWGWPVSPANTRQFFLAAQKVRGIQRLSLVGMKLDTKVLDAVALFPELRHLAIIGRTEVDATPRESEEGNAWFFQTLAKSHRLESLTLGHQKRVAFSGLSHLIALPKLRQFRSDTYELDESFFVELSKLSTLQELCLPNASISASAIRHLQSLSRLRSLTTKGLDAPKIEALTALHQLEHLTIYGDPKTEGAGEIGKLPRLLRLTIIGAQ